MTVHSLTLTNPGAETGDTTGWTSRSGGVPGVLTNPGGGLPHSGTYAFVATSSGSTAKWDQEVDVSAYATAIDAETAAVKFAGWHKGFSGDGDSGALYVECYDTSHVLLDSITYSATDPSAWTQETRYHILPALTRYVRVGTTNTRSSGTELSSYWDDFTLDLSDDYSADYAEALAAKVYQVAAYAWGSQPADELRTSQIATYVWGAGEESSGLSELRSHQVAVYAWVKGYVERPHVRAWTFSLDGHDFYVLRLGTLSTVVFDVTTGQWSEWNGHSLPYWRAVKGINWLGMGPDTANRLYGTNVVAGDDRAGILWMLDPTTGVDDGTASDQDPVPYTRAVTGVVQQKMRQTAPIGGVYVTLSLGEPAISGASITLSTSDDWGKSYTDAGTITITPSDYSQEIAWRSLGLIRAPGKVFQLSDDGAAIRINYAEMK